MASRKFGHSAKRQTTWFQFAPVEQTVTSGAALVFSLNAAALAMRPFTIVRAHFEIMIRSDQAAAVEQQLAGIGMAVVSDEAVAVGVSAVPTPITEMASHLWFLHRLIFADASTLTDRTIPAKSLTIDSKAMRKVEVGSDIILAVEHTVGGGWIMDIGGRLLVKNN